MKKIIALILATAMMLSVVACSSSTNESDTSSDSSSSSSDTSTDDETEEDDGLIELSFSYLSVGDLAQQDSWSTIAIQEALLDYGYDVEIELITYGTTSSSEWGTKHALALASGEMPPDVMQLSSPSDTIDAGWCAEITQEMVAEYMPEVYAQTNEVYEYIWSFCTDTETGALYGIPSFNMYGTSRHTFVYRQDWLDAFDMDVPVTIDDFEEWLIACATQDPDGNGINDTYGYTAEDYTGYFGEVFAAFGANHDAWMFDDDGSIIHGSVHEGMIEGLEYLQRWYAEGLIPAGVMTTADRDVDFYSGFVGTMCQASSYAPALVETGAAYTALIASQPDAEIVVTESFQGPDGDSGTYQWGPKKYALMFGVQLEEDYEKLTNIMSMFELIATTPELFEIAMLGEQGTHWDFVDVEAGSGATEFLDIYTDYDLRLDEVGVREMSESVFCPVWVEDVYSNYLDPTALEYASSQQGYYSVILNTLPSNDLYNEYLSTLIKTAIYDIVTGAQPVDYYYEVIDLWYANGGQVLTDEANEIYNAMVG